MSIKEKERFKGLIDKHKKEMPRYIIEYIETNTELSPATLYAYITEKENKDLVLLRDQLGHTSVEVTSTYTNINIKKKREAIDQIEKKAI